jgi:hypothetical protein
MSDLLERAPESTATSRDVWRDKVLAVFTDATPVTRPSVPSAPFLALDTLVNYITARLGTPLVGDPHSVSRTRSGALGSALNKTDAREGSVHPGTRALAELQGWLNLPLDQLVELAGLSASTRAFWRGNPTAPIRPGKTGRLLRLRAAVGLLVGSIGLTASRALLHREGWLDEPFDESRLVALEARVQQQLIPGGLVAPAHLREMTRDELAAAVVGESDEPAQLQLDREQAVQLDPDDDAGEP